MHRRNMAEHAIHTFKAHFLVTLAGTCAQLPKFLWDQLLEQAEITINLMCQATSDPSKSAREYFHVRPFNYDATALGPLGIPVIVHNKPSRLKSWYYRGRNGFSASVALNHYRCQ